MIAQVQNDWVVMACRLFGAGDLTYLPSAAYVEFVNVPSPGDEATIPSFGETAGAAYYQGLSASTDHDYLRVQLLANPTISLSPDGAAIGLPLDTLTFLAQTEGSVGINGKPFTAGANSTVIGMAVVATPVWADATQDRVLARCYYEGGEQVPKQTLGQVVVTYAHTFGPANGG